MKKVSSKNKSTAVADMVLSNLHELREKVMQLELAERKSSNSKQSEEILEEIRLLEQRIITRSQNKPVKELVNNYSKFDVDKEFSLSFEPRYVRNKSFLELVGSVLKLWRSEDNIEKLNKADDSYAIYNYFIAAGKYLLAGKRKLEGEQAVSNDLHEIWI